MEYTGKLYGKIGNKYFDTGFASEDYDKLQKENSELQKQVLNLQRVITRSCPNCGHDNTKEESCNKYTCKYCESEPDTNW